MIDPRGLKLFIVDIAFLALVWLFFSLRVLVTITRIKRVSLYDIFMFASIVSVGPTFLLPSMVL